ncbi:MAG: ATP-binding cassette domain-containing protein [Candidatus Dormiibacterota bacterium]
MSAAVGSPRGSGIDVHCDSVVLLYSSDEGDVAALRGVDLDISAGEVVAILGPSGSGKSSLLALFTGLLRPSAGHVRLGPHEMGKLSGRELQRLRATTVSLVLQDPAQALLPYATAEQNVGLAQWVGRTGDRPAMWTANELLDLLGMGGLASQTLATMSGGEQQRVAIAAGICVAPQLLLLDEPTSQLDALARDEVIEMLLAVNSELGATVVTVTHDPAVAAAMPRTISIRDGRVGSEGRRGHDFAVIGKDGSLQLPTEILTVLPPGALVRVVPLENGAQVLRSDDPDPPSG